MNSVSGGLTQLIIKSVKTVLMFNQDFKGVIILFIKLKFCLYLLVEIEVLTTVLSLPELIQFNENEFLIYILY